MKEKNIQTEKRTNVALSVQMMTAANETGYPSLSNSRDDELTSVAQLSEVFIQISASRFITI